MRWGSRLMHVHHYPQFRGHRPPVPVRVAGGRWPPARQVRPLPTRLPASLILGKPRAPAPAAQRVPGHTRPNLPGHSKWDEAAPTAPEPAMPTEPDSSSSRRNVDRSASVTPPAASGSIERPESRGRAGRRPCQKGVNLSSAANAADAPVAWPCQPSAVDSWGIPSFFRTSFRGQPN
jgi:hypothetical protein